MNTQHTAVQPIKEALPQKQAYVRPSLETVEIDKGTEVISFS